MCPKDAGWNANSVGAVLSGSTLLVQTCLSVTEDHDGSLCFRHLLSLSIYLLFDLFCCFAALQQYWGHFECSQLTYPFCSWAGFLSGLPVLSAHTFASNWQLPSASHEAMWPLSTHLLAHLSQRLIWWACRISRPLSRMSSTLCFPWSHVTFRHTLIS